MPANNFVLGRGRVYVARVSPGGKQPGPYRYVGISRELNLTAETEDLEHSSSEAGVNEVDDRIQLSVTRTGTLTIEDIDFKNLGLFFFGSAGSGAQAVDSGNQTWTLSGALLKDLLDFGEDDTSQILVGATAANPLGARALQSTPLTVAGMNSAGTPQAVTLAQNTDWEVVDLARGTIRLLDTNKTYSATGDAILSRITVTYRRAAIASVEQMVSGGTPFEGSLKLFENNARGSNSIWTLPLVTISPNGDLALKAEEWRQIPLSLSVQKPANAQAIYVEGQHGG